MTLKKRSKNDPKSAVTLEEWCNFFSAKMAEEVFNSFEKEYAKIGHENYVMLVGHFLAGFISATVYRSLAVLPLELEGKKQEQYEFAQAQFGEIKEILADAVSAGVQGGILTWSGKSIEYYTQIKVTPEPVNKEYPC